MKGKLLGLDAVKLNNIGSGGSDFSVKEVSNRDIAIIGLSCIMPMADDAEQFWNNIRDGKNCIQDFPEVRRKDIDDYMLFKKVDLDKTKYLKGAYLKNIDKFDYNFFNMTPKAASLTNPIQRLFLSTAWEAIEDAGYGGAKLSGTNTGVYVGFISDVEGYKYKQMVSDVESTSMLQISITGNLSAIIPSRISYLLDLKGPSMLVDTACSSSLVSVHLACQAIRNGDCDLAIAGGIRVGIIPVDDGIKIGMESSDGITRAFDDGSDGTGIGEGCGAVLLKPLSKAQRDGDHIYAVIKGTAINQDGNSMGITAPNAEAQSDVIAKAWKDAGINPETISYIEAHGTGTRLGDPIEIDGITKAFRRYTDRKQFCAIGSVKTNIGHLYEGAGIAALIKAVLALKHKQLPPSINFNLPNSKIEFEESPVYLNKWLADWETDGFPRRCGISSFGFSGTNCHIVLEEMPETEVKGNAEEEMAQFFTISAKSKDALKAYIAKYRQFFENRTALDLEGICYTANTGRGHYSHRLVLIAKNERELREKINELDNTELEKIKDDSVYYGEHKAVSDSKAVLRDKEITESSIKNISIKANEKLKEYLETKQETGDILREIFELYTAGAYIEWEMLYRGRKVRRLPIPTYALEPKRCWVTIPGIEELRKEAGGQSLYHAITWKREKLVASDSVPESGAVIVLKDGNSKAEELIQKLKQDGSETIEVELGSSYKKLSENSYCVDGTEECWKKLLEEVNNRKPGQLIHMSSLLGINGVDNLEQLRQSQEKGVYSVFHIAKALLTSEIKRNFDILLVSDYVNEVTGQEERINPHNATMVGLGKIISIEYPHIRCKCLDIDDCTTASDIAAEVKAAVNTYQAAYRKGERYIEEFNEVSLENIRDRKIEIRKNGVYVITGGTGGIGLEIAGYLASRNKVNLCLISRSKMPEREKWDEILLKEHKDKNVCRRIKAIKEIEAKGSSVSCFSGDVSDSNQLKAVLDSIRSRYGCINGLIHSAGVPGNGFIIKKEKEEFDSILSPKVYGTWNLDRLTRDDAPDFFVMFSSGLSVAGVPGQGDYAAANSYLDSYTFYRNKSGKRTLTISWGAWKETGMAADGNFNMEAVFKSIYTKKALEAFEEVLNKDIKRIIAGELVYNEKAARMAEKLPFRLSATIKSRLEKYRTAADQTKKEQRPGKLPEVSLKGKVQGDYSETEKKIAQVCREVFGFEEINIYDNFLEIGADSIALSRVHERLQEFFPDRLTISQMFVYPTISKLAQYLNSQEEAAAEEEEDEDIEKKLGDLLEQMETGNLSIDDAIENLGKM